MAGLRQPGLALLSSHFADPPEPKDHRTDKMELQKEFGGAYKVLRGRGKSKFVKLSTGGVWVKPKTDCWLTFEDFQRLTE